MSFREAVYRLVRRVPRGRVVTYGQVAALLARPRASRAVGSALRTCPADVPWHRVVNVRGGISRRPRPAAMLTQRLRLEQEGVAFRGARVVLTSHRWRVRGLAQELEGRRPYRWGCSGECQGGRPPRRGGRAGWNWR